MDTIALSRMIPRPRQRRAYVVDSLYGDRLSFFIGGLAVVSAAAYTAVRTGEGELWLVTAGIAFFVVLRLAAFAIFLGNASHADRHPVFWKRLYSWLAVAHLALIGTWTALTHWLTVDEFSQTLSVFVALGYMIGAQGRNFSSLPLVQCQLIACILPMIVGFTALSTTRAVILGLFLAAFYFSVVGTSRRIRGILHDAIEASEENWRLAHTDALTGLPNGTSMRTTIQRLIREGRPFTLLIVDIETHRRVMETLGQLASDQFIRQMGGTIREVVGRGSLVAREPGDRFQIVHPDGEARSAEELARALLDVIGRPSVVNGITMQGACSIGAAHFPGDGLLFEEISHHADMALFEARAAGGQRFVTFAPGTPDRAADRLQLENDLRQALRDDLIELHFQPILENGTYRVVGCEALARWPHPTRGSIPPGDFLVVAEDAGLMDDLTDRTLIAGCRAAASWPASMQVSINLSPSQLLRTDLIPTIAKSLKDSGLSPDRLEIEITETMVLETHPCVIETLRRISAMGVRLSLDDFGTGYSNLGRIALLPIGKIKLDKSFLDGLGQDERRTAVLRGAVRFIATLGLELVMEGVETEAHVRFAASEPGVSLLQGFAFARPMPEAEILDYLREKVDDAERLNA